MVRLTIISVILLSFTLLSCNKDCGELTWYLDEDGDGYGNPADSLLLVGCNRPEGYVLDNNDCDDQNADINPDAAGTLTWFADNDGDGFGNPADTLLLVGCNRPEGYVLDNTDCNDQDENFHPGAADEPNDGIDSDCSTVIWTGSMMAFTKETNVDWTLPENQDKITENVIFTRQNSKQLYNYQWWQDKFAQDVTGNDLSAEFWNGSTTLDFIPSGGTKGVRWAILDDTGADNPWDANFNLYGTLGDPSNFYSFHNIATIITQLNNGNNVVSIEDDFSVNVEGGGQPSGTVMSQLEGKNLGAWLVEDEIYITFTFTTWGIGRDGNGGAISYMRSTPPE